MLKALKDALAVRGRYADAGVGHGKANIGPLPLHPEDHAALLGEFEGVPQQVEENLLDLRPVAEDIADLGFHLACHEKLLGPRQRAEAVDALGHQPLDIDFAPVQLGLPRLQLGDVEQVVDQSEQVPAVVGDDLDVLALVRRERASVPLEE